MKYYLAQKPWEPEILGVTDGMSQARVDEKGFKNKEHFETFMYSFGSPLRGADDQEAFSIDFDLECVRLRKRAKITDFLWFSPMSYCLFSTRVRAILSEFKLQDHRYFPAVLSSDTEKVNYSFMYMKSFGSETIDFPKCKFEVGNEFDGYENVFYASFEDFHNSKYIPVIKKMAFKGIDGSFEMFKPKLVSGKVISKNLKDRLENEKVTGIKFKEIEIEFN